MSNDEMYWLRELCSEGSLNEWPPEAVLESLTQRGFIFRRVGAIGVTEQGRAAAAIRSPGPRQHATTTRRQA